MSLDAVLAAIVSLNGATPSVRTLGTDKMFSGAMSQVLELSILGLDETFPDKLFVLHHPSSGRYGCFCHEGVHGLACFSTEGGAVRFSEWIDLSGMKTEELSFEEAREVAKSRPMPVVSLMLLDHLNDPKIHYVR